MTFQAIAHPEAVKFGSLVVPKARGVEPLRSKSVVLEPHEIRQVNKVVMHALLGEVC